METSFGATFPSKALLMMCYLLCIPAFSTIIVNNVELYCVAAPYAYICCLFCYLQGIT